MDCVRLASFCSSSNSSSNPARACWLFCKQTHTCGAAVAAAPLLPPQVLRMVDEIYVNTIKEFGLYDEIWQAFAVFLPIKSVGVQGDQRTHRCGCACGGLKGGACGGLCGSAAAVTGDRSVYPAGSGPPGSGCWRVLGPGQQLQHLC